MAKKHFATVEPETEDTEDVQGHKKHASEDPRSPDTTDQDTEGHVKKT
jgi:hypothetical protein